MDDPGLRGGHPQMPRQLAAQALTLDSQHTGALGQEAKGRIVSAEHELQVKIGEEGHPQIVGRETSKIRSFLTNIFLLIIEIARIASCSGPSPT